MDPVDDTVALAAATRQFLTAQAADSLAELLESWPAPRPMRPITPRSLPVLRFLPEAARRSPPACAALAAALARASQALSWRQTYAAPEVGEAFLANYGWTELAGASGPLVTDLFACGFLLLGPDTLYPSHRHPAEEYYVPLSGEARWQRGAEEWLHRCPGSLIHHRSEETHSMRTGATPMLALYLWQGFALHEPARLTDHARTP